MAIDIKDLSDSELELLASGDKGGWARVAAQKHGVPEYLIDPIIKQESGGDQSAVSPKGARGVMQLMPGTARSLGVNPNDWAENIWGGMKYLGTQLDTFGTPELALAAYNAGPGRVKGGRVPNIKETKNYVRNITNDVDVTTLSDEELAALASGERGGAESAGGITSCVGDSCGDALGKYLNTGPLKGTGLALPRGGIGPDTVADLGKTLGAPVYNRSNLSLEALTPGTVIHMTRRPGDRNYRAGATHIGIVDQDEQGSTVFRSFTPGKGWRAEPVDQQFINALPAQIIAANISGSALDRRMGAVAATVDVTKLSNEELAQLAAGKMPSSNFRTAVQRMQPAGVPVSKPPAPPEVDVTKLSDKELTKAMGEQSKYGITDAIGDLFGDAYKYVKNVLSPGVNKDLEKAKAEFLKQNPDADVATVDAVHAKLKEISAAHQMPLGEALVKNIRDFVNGIIAPVQGVNKAIDKAMPQWIEKLNEEARPAIAATNEVTREVFPPPPFGVISQEADKIVKDRLREADIPGKVESFLHPKDEKMYKGEGLVRAPGRVLGTLIPYAGAGKVVQAAGIPATTFFQKLLFNTATFMPVDLAVGYKEADMDGVVKALWHSPITAALFTVGGLPKGKVTGTVGVGLAGAGSAAAAGERDPAKLAEAFGTMAILHNILKTKPERATAEVKEFIKENNVSDTEVTALKDKLESLRKQYAAERATPEQRAPEPTPEEVQAGVDKLKQEYVAGEEAALVTPADLAPEVVEALRKGQLLSPSQDIVLQDKIKAALIGQRTAPQGAAWEQFGFSPEAPGLLTDRTMASGAVEEGVTAAQTKEQTRVEDLADEGVTPMYSGGPDTSEIMKRLSGSFAKDPKEELRVRATVPFWHATNDIKNIADKIGTIKLYHGAPRAFAEQLVNRLNSGERLDQKWNSAEEILRWVAKEYDIPYTVLYNKTGAGHLVDSYSGDKVGRSSTAPAEVASRWATSFPYGEIISDLNTSARLYLEAKRRGIPYEDFYEQIWNETGPGSTTTNIADRLRLPDKLKGMRTGGSLVEIEVDARALPDNVASRAKSLLRYQETLKNRGDKFDDTDAAIAWNTDYKDIKIHPSNFKSAKIVADLTPAAKYETDYLYSGGPDTSELMRKLAPVWYSRAQRFIGEKLPNVGTGPGLANTIDNWLRKGVIPGKEEVKWTGVVPWLQERKGKVSRQEVVDFLKENGVELRVVERGTAVENLTAEQAIRLEYLYNEAQQRPLNREEHNELRELNAVSMSSEPKFESYVKPPPGSSNYREFYGVWPAAERADYAKKLEAKYGPIWLTKATDAEIAELKGSSEKFRVPSGHETGDPSADVNRVFHAFTWDQVIGGKKYLVIGELQSDWAGKGRKDGYKDTETITRMKAEKSSIYNQIAELEKDRKILKKSITASIEKGHKPATTEVEDARELRYRIQELGNEADKLGVALRKLEQATPEFPFMKNWMEVAMKKMLRQAAEEGYDGLAWVSGDVVKERYDLSKVYDNVSSEKRANNYIVTAPDGRWISEYDNKASAESMLASLEGKGYFIQEEPGGYHVTATRLDTGDTVDVGVFKDAKAMKDAGIAEDMAEKLVKAEKKELKLPEGTTLELYKGDWYVREDGSLLDWTRSETKEGTVDGYYNNEDVSGVIRPGTVRLTGVDLKLGGEWANKQYDSINPTTGEKVFGMPVFMDKYGKQWGARVGEKKIGSAPKHIDPYLHLPEGWEVKETYEGKYLVYDEAGHPFGGEHSNANAAWMDALNILNEAAKTDALGTEQKVHTLDITPKMEETVLEQGQYMFSGGPDTSEWFKSLFRTGNAGKVLKGMTPAQLEVASRISVGDHEKKSWTTPTDIYTAIMDRYHPLKKYMEQYGKLPQAITDNVYKLARLFEGWTGKAEAFIHYHPWDRKTFEFKQNVKGLADILKPIEKAGDIEQFRTFLVARRAVERAGRGFETGVDLEAARKTVSELGRKFGEDAAQYDLYTDSILQYARDAGLISNERYGQIREGSTDYTPLLRVMELESKTAGGKGFTAAQVIKQFKGSEREIIDPLESTVRLTYALVNAAERNSVVDSLIRWAKESGAFGDSIHEINQKAIPIDVQLNEVLKNKEVRQYLANSGLTEKDAVIFRPSAFQPSPNTISVWEGGERKFYNVPKEVADVVKGMSEQTADIWMRLLSFPAQALRLGATTLSPEFGLRNFLKDQFPAFIHSKYGYKPFIDYIRGVTEMARGGEQYWQYMISGAPHGELISMDRRLLQNKLRDVLSGKLSMPGFLVRHPIEAAKLLSEYSERGTRIGEFKKGLEFEGATPEGIQSAGYQSREVTVDFGRKGAVGKFINMTTAFWNPGLQGLNKVVRAHRENLLPTMGKAIAAVTIPSMLLEAAFGDDPRYQDLPPWRKDLFFNIPTKYGVVSLPKPWTYGLLYGAIPQRIMRGILKEDPHAYDGLLEAVGKEVPDFPLPTAITPFIEIWADKKLFTGTPLMPEWKKNLPAKFQFSGYTPETMKMLGDMVSNIPVVGESWMASPVALNHLLLSWTGGTGRLFTDAMDYSLRKSGVLTVIPPPAARLADTPVVRAFFARYPSLDAEPLQRFRTRTVKSAAKMRLLTAQVMDIAMEGKQHQLLPLINELGPDTAMNLSQMSTAFNEMSKFAHLIERSKDMSPEQKRESIDKIYLSMIAAAKETNRLVDAVLEQSKRMKVTAPLKPSMDRQGSIFR